MGDENDDRLVDKRAASRMSEGGDAAAAASNTAAEAGPPEAGEDIATLKEQSETYYRNWQRTAADFINYKRRVEQERSESARLASAALVINLLPVFDDLDRAVGSVDSTLAGLNWVQGVSAIHQKFGRLLDAMGAKEVAAEGEMFDPARHEAIGKQPGEEGKVLHVAQKGYELQGKVIRPAMVIVGESP